MFDKMKQIYELKKKADEIQKKLETIKVEQIEDGNKLKMNGLFKVESLEIDPSNLMPDKKEKLEKAISSLISKSIQEIQKKSALESRDLLKGLSL